MSLKTLYIDGGNKEELKKPSLKSMKSSLHLHLGDGFLSKIKPQKSI
jgi:hypothetical protein